MKIVLFVFLLSEAAKPASETATDSTAKPNSMPSVARNRTKSRNSKQRADEAWRYGAQEDMAHSIQELMMDSYLQKLFPGKNIANNIKLNFLSRPWHVAIPLQRIYVNAKST